MKGLLATVCLVATDGLRAADPFTVKADKADPPGELSEAVRELLAKERVTVADAKGVGVAEFWFRTEVPGKGTADQVKNGLTYRELTETNIVAAVRFPAAFTDYRKQEIAAGVYTLRLAFQPDTGDHKDTAPHNEFLLLCPAAQDTTADELEAKALHKLSFAATGGEHPGVLLLYPYANPAAEPKLIDRGTGVWTLNVRRPVAAEGGPAEMGFAVTVAGFSKTR